MRPPFPDDEPRHFPGDDGERGWRLKITPAGLALMLLIVSLTIFFVAGLVGFIYVRFTSQYAPAFGEVRLPLGLWFSTAALIASGFTMRFAQRAAASGILGHVRLFLVLTLGLGVLFVGIQIPSLRSLLLTHYEVLDDNVATYGFTAVLIAMHGLHVLGGFVPLSWFTWQALRDQPPHPTPAKLAYMEMYWHFLHGIWLLMFLVFFILS